MKREERGMVIVSLEISEDQKNSLRKIAKEDDRSMSYHLRCAIKEYINKTMSGV